MAKNYSWSIGRSRHLRFQKRMDAAKDEMLDAMDFIWDPARYRFKAKMLPACKIYVQQKGDLNTMLTSFKGPKTPGLAMDMVWAQVFMHGV